MGSVGYNSDMIFRGGARGVESRARSARKLTGRPEIARFFAGGAAFFFA
jgi:hypothetical protein